MQNNEIRCGHCARKLGQGHYVHLVIKCPRCKALNSLRATSPTPARHRTLNPQTANDEGNQLFNNQ